MSNNSVPSRGGAASDEPEKRKTSPRKSKPELEYEPAPVETFPPVSDDPFDPSNLATMRLSQDFASMAAVKPVITTVAARKPAKHEFVRVRAGSEWRFETGCFIDKETREVYLVTPDLWPAMPGDVTPTALVLAVSRNSPVPFLWPLTLPSSDGRPNRWHESAVESARLAEAQWLRSVADMGAGCYVPYVAAAKLPEPEWPEDLQMRDYLRLSFQGRFIRDICHPCLQRLRGEI